MSPVTRIGGGIQVASRGLVLGDAIRASAVIAGAAPFVEDPFTDTSATPLQSHTGTTGATWTRHPLSSANNIVISNANRVRVGTASVTLIYYASGVPPSAEYDVTATFRPITFETTDVSGIAGRLDTTANTLYGARYDVTNARWQLFRVVAGGALTDMGTFAQTLTLGTNYVCKLEIRNAAKKLYVDGVERISSADNTITGTGRVGLRMFASQNTDAAGMHIDTLSAIAA